MSERTIVEQRDVGYKWSMTIEREIRIPSGLKWPDKSVIHVTLQGNELSFESCKVQLENARQVIEDKIAKAAKVPEEVKGGLDAQKS